MLMHKASEFHPSEMISADAIPDGHLALSPRLGNRHAGLLAGSLVETAGGWRRVETLSPGACVATFDGGYAKLTRVEHRTLWPALSDEVIFVPAGALDNCSDFSLLADQLVLLTSDIAQEVLDAPGAMFPAAALVGFRGITRQPILNPVEVLTLRFADEEVVYVNSGALIHCAAEGPDAKSGAMAKRYFEVLEEPRAQAMLGLMAAGVVTTHGVQQAA